MHIVISGNNIEFSLSWNTLGASGDSFQLSLDKYIEQGNRLTKKGFESWSKLSLRHVCRTSVRNHNVWLLLYSLKPIFNVPSGRNAHRTLTFCFPKSKCTYCVLRFSERKKEIWALESCIFQFNLSVEQASQTRKVQVFYTCQLQGTICDSLLWWHCSSVDSVATSLPIFIIAPIQSDIKKKLLLMLQPVKVHPKWIPWLSWCVLEVCQWHRDCGLRKQLVTFSL